MLSLVYWDDHNLYIGYDMLIMHQQTIIFWISCDEQYPKRKKMGRKMEETSKER